MNIKGIAWIGMVSDDPNMQTFYAHTLGLPLLDSSDQYAYYDAGDMTRLEILAIHSTTAALQRHDAPAIGFLVDDLDEGVKVLNDAGVRLLTEIKTWRSGDVIHRWIYFHDPSGNVLLLLERHGET